MDKPFRNKMRKSIDLRHHFLQDSTDQRLLVIKHAPASKQKSAMFTETLKHVMFNTQCQMMGVEDDQTKHGTAPGECGGLTTPAVVQP